MPSRRPRNGLIAALAALSLIVTSASTATAAVQQPPGGPILVVTSSADPFSYYDSEILRNEGLDDFAVADVSDLAARLPGHDTVILAPSALTDAQVSTLSAWVQSGGNLIAMRPDKKLAPLLGLADTGGTTENGNLQIDGSQAPGAGITSSSPLQFHGTADLYTLAGARAVATLVPDGNPAVSLKTVGSGHAAAFTYDLARSVVWTRQGNPSWAGENRDKFAFVPTSPNPDPVIRSNDLFFGGEPGDFQPDWVDLNRVAIPQADEQQRLLANLIVQYSVTPTPRFWYLPRGYKAAIALTGDDHGGGGTSSVFDHLLSLGPSECQRTPAQYGQPISQAVLDTWECPRGTSYVWPDNGLPIDDTEASNWTKYGFEFSDHPMIQQSPGCLDYTPATLKSSLDTELGIFHQKYPSVAGPVTTRTHCIVYSDWASQPKEDVARGIRLNTDYYYFPPEWTQNRPGLFTGSGMPMRFADCDGSLIDVYQASTYVADDATAKQGEADNANTVVPAMTKALIDRALGSDGYYGAFTVQVHTDFWAHAAARDALVAYAMSKGVPVISEAQLLRWLDGRNASSFKNVSYGTDGKLAFTIDQAAGAAGLQAMLPAQGLIGLTSGGQAVSFDVQTIKGVAYAVFAANSGDYVATYSSHPAVAQVASTYTGTIPGGTGGSGSCEGAGEPGTNPPGGGTGTNGGNGSGGNGSTGTTGGSTTGSSGGSGSAHITETNSTERKPHANAFVTASAAKFRPGGKRTFVLTVRLARTARLVLTIRDANGNVVRRIRVGTRNAGSVVRLRWDGRNARGRYVAAGSYAYAVTAVGAKGYLRTARGSVKVLTAR